MQFTEGGPAEFLFGSFKTIEETTKEIVQPNNPKKWEIFLLFTGIFYASTVIALIGLFDSIVEEMEIITIFMFIFVFSMISTLKNYIQLKRYGSHLVHYRNISPIFMLIQSLFAHFIVGLVLLASYIGLVEMELLNYYFSITIISFLLILSYARLLSNISLVTGGLGIGLVPSLGGISSLVNNFSLLFRIQGRKEYHMGILRLFFILGIIATINTKYAIVSNVLIVLGFIFLYLKWEKVNASSTIMQIRGVIQSMAPANLPELNFDMEDSFIMREPNVDIDDSTRQLPAKISFNQRNSRNDNHQSISPMKEDLTPIAAKSINRIVSSILKENQ